MNIWASLSRYQWSRDVPGFGRVIHAVLPPRMYEMTYNVFSGTLNPTHFTSSSVRAAVWRDRVANFSGRIWRKQSLENSSVNIIRFTSLAVNANSELLQWNMLEETEDCIRLQRRRVDTPTFSARMSEVVDICQGSSWRRLMLISSELQCPAISARSHHASSLLTGAFYTGCGVSFG